MPKFNNNAISIYYEVHGKGEPIVFIAGFSADHLAWSGIIDELKDHYQLILFDNRGAGQTDAPVGPYSIEVMMNDVMALCSHLNIKKANFVGSSMGGFILQMLAFKHPHLVKSAIISKSTTTVNCCFQIYVLAQLELMKAKAPITELTKASCSWAFSYHFLSQPGMLDQLVQQKLANPFPFSLTGYEGQYVALDQFDSREWVSQIKVPTLVIGSDQDLIFNENSVKFLADSIPKAEYERFTECGHLPYIEYPEKFCNLIKPFLARHND